MLGLVFPPQLGLFFVTIKLQIGLAIATLLPELIVAVIGLWILAIIRLVG